MVARLRTWLGGAPQYDGIGARIMTTARRVAIAATLGVVVLTAVGLTLSRGNPEDVEPAATQAKPATKVAKKPTCSLSLPTGRTTSVARGIGRA